jgi:hypothetical protein
VGVEVTDEVEDDLRSGESGQVGAQAAEDGTDLTESDRAEAGDRGQPGGPVNASGLREADQGRPLIAPPDTTIKAPRYDELH